MSKYDLVLEEINKTRKWLTKQLIDSSLKAARIDADFLRQYKTEDGEDCFVYSWQPSDIDVPGKDFTVSADDPLRIEFMEFDSNHGLVTDVHLFQDMHEKDSMYDAEAKDKNQLITLLKKNLEKWFISFAEGNKNKVSWNKVDTSDPGWMPWQ